MGLVGVACKQAVIGRRTKPELVQCFHLSVVATLRESSYLVCKKHHDCVAASTMGCVLDREGIVVIPNDIKVYVCLIWAHHTWGTLDTNAHITCEKGGETE